MRLSLIGMAGTGKSYWSSKLEKVGFKRFCCDDLIEKKLKDALKRPDGSFRSMGQWMGFPYEQGYREREAKYMALEREVMADIIAYLEDHAQDSEEALVIDTTGSVIYIGDDMMRRLRRQTTIVCLSAPSEVEARLLDAYIKKPHPMLWHGTFDKRPGESNGAAMARCYPRLFSARKRLYEQYIDVAVDYYMRRKEGFDTEAFLSFIEKARP